MRIKTVVFENGSDSTTAFIWAGDSSSGLDQPGNPFRLDIDSAF
jgi:hypothetical protein